MNVRAWIRADDWLQAVSQALVEGRWMGMRYVEADSESDSEGGRFSSVPPRGRRGRQAGLFLDIEQLRGQLKLGPPTLGDNGRLEFYLHVVLIFHHFSFSKSLSFTTMTIHHTSGYPRGRDRNAIQFTACY
jgi:hypothetical protein